MVSSKPDELQSRCLLTICIPSYNRGQRVRALVDSLLPLVTSQHGRIELLVVNNCSQDDTYQLLSEVKASWFRCHHRSEFLPTAEENMFASVSLCQGEYVWFLGDDDIPQHDTVQYLMDILDTGGSDLLFFNFGLISENGGFLAHRAINMNAEVLSIPLEESLFTLGFTFSFAGISNLVMARRFLSEDIAHEIRSCAVIYSHVAWILSAFSRRNITIVNRPLVLYRNGSLDLQDDHFKKLARKMDVGDQYFWGIGLLELLGYLMDHGILTGRQIGRIWETRRDLTRYRLLDLVVFEIYKQAALARRDHESRNQLSLDTFERAAARVVSIDPIYFDCIEYIRRIINLKNKSSFGRISLRNATRTFEINFNEVSETIRQFNGYRSTYKGFSIYCACMGYVAFSNEHHVDRQRVLSFVDPIEHIPLYFVAPTIESLYAKIEAATLQSAVSPERFRYELLITLNRWGDSTHVLAAHVGRIASQYGEIAGPYRRINILARWAVAPIKAVYRGTRLLLFKIVPLMDRRNKH